MKKGMYLTILLSTSNLHTNLANRPILTRSTCQNLYKSFLFVHDSFFVNAFFNSKPRQSSIQLFSLIPQVSDRQVSFDKTFPINNSLFILKITFLLFHIFITVFRVVIGGCSDTSQASHSLIESEALTLRRDVGQMRSSM